MGGSFCERKEFRGEIPVHAWAVTCGWIAVVSVVMTLVE
ncbi:hypothetical protein D187_002956 [Cystobacter fuscus DSM 2262]|uniref:Uncharacterized protein n=1 Tax=Cystobacter fuscus (strain ATCC 25194 / DSM 2262 / NBRC 100088 / M29) TaxID=1242864 RepID=S9P8J3_CYSF2|nr:hypothetical protein D187_002956 [Cystobacter fuscus DSM 2262]